MKGSQMATDKSDSKTEKATQERAKALDTALAQIERQFGKGSIMKMGEASNLTVEAIPTGCLSLDMALGVGGLPKGEFLDAFGADIFFDDQEVHCDSARQYVATGHVPSGIKNQNGGD